MKVTVTRKRRLTTLLLISFLGVVICFWQLGETGLVDETPPLFAAAGRAMRLTGDWLTPRVNGLPRFDKPPLVYWLMSIGYSVPGNAEWDPLGTYAARFPSAIASFLMAIALTDTVIRWPHKNDNSPSITAVVTSLAFLLSPLVMIWSRIAVSDALLCGTLGLSLLSHWRCYANPLRQSWIIGWLLLGFAVLAKGPVAIVLSVMTLGLFATSKQVNFSLLKERLRPQYGFLITIFVSGPWYLLELIVEGKPFWDSFFGYHNFQRFTTVVNSHQAPWWFFVFLLIVASIPFTPFLFMGIYKSLSSAWMTSNDSEFKSEETLFIFAICWLASVFILFTCAATKLPSYWLPATPAAALLIGSAAASIENNSFQKRIVFRSSSVISMIIAIIFWTSPAWLLYVKDPEMPTLGIDLIESNLVIVAAVFFSLISIFVFLSFQDSSSKLLGMQSPLILFHLFSLLPMVSLGDQIRQLPLRQVSELLKRSQRYGEPLVMMGVKKPSIHFYTNQVIIYEGNTARNLLNASDRLWFENRKGSNQSDQKSSATALIVIDKKTSNLPHWKGLRPEELGKFSIYKVWRIDRKILDLRAKEIYETGERPNWRAPKPERY